MLNLSHITAELRNVATFLTVDVTQLHIPSSNGPLLILNSNFRKAAMLLLYILQKKIILTNAAYL